MMLTLMVTSKGVAAVPRASLVILAGTLASFGLPLEAVAAAQAAAAAITAFQPDELFMPRCHGRRW